MATLGARWQPLSQPQLQRRHQRRQRRQPCRAEATGEVPGQPTPGSAAGDAVLDRIRKAREYKKTAPGQQAAPEPPAQQAARAEAPPVPPPAAAAAAAPPVQQQPASQGVEAAFDAAAQQLASRDEAEFLQAVAQASSSAAQQQPAAPSAPAGGSTGGGGASREAMLARINKAKQYGKPQQPQQPAVAGPPAGSSVGSSSSAAPAAGDPPAAPAAPPAETAQEEAERKRSFRTGGGSADLPANWLRFAEGSGAAAASLDRSLSPEQFTLAKEELIKKQEVEIVTVDAGYAQQLRREKQRQVAGEGGAQPAQQEQQEAQQGGGEQEGEGDELHKPKVATWGVFPRPRNISEAYGGGRNLRPGQALESEEAAAAREQRVAAALKDYRKTLGLDVDPAVEARAQALYDQGVALFEQGLLTAALPKFAEASELMALRSRLGGEARLQQAICLDSLARSQEAYEIYTRLENHSAPGVAKKAKRMLFGWKAAENLKTSRLSYQPDTAQWKRYFDVLSRSSLYNNTYVAAEDGAAAEGGDAFAAVAAVAVGLLPLAFVGYRVLLAQQVL